MLDPRQRARRDPCRSTGSSTPMEHRIVSLLPLSHALEQAVVAVLRAQRRRRRPVRPQPQPAGDLRRAARAPGHEHGPRARRCSTCSGARSSARSRSRAGRRRSIGCAASPGACRTPVAAAPVPAASTRQFGGGLRLFATAGAFLPPALQQAWEDMGVVVIQGYGATETFAGAATTMNDHPLGCVGWPPKPVEMRIVEDGEIQFRGPSLTPGYWNDPEATAAAFTEDGWYKSGDLGASTTRAGSTSTGARRTSSCCPTASTCSPRTSRTRCGWPGSATRWRSRRSPGGSRPSCWRPGRTRSRATRARRRRSRPPRPRTCGARSTPRSRPRTRSLGPEPADRRLARLARGRLPAHPHVQGQARPGPGVGGDRRAAAGGRRGLSPASSARCPAGQEGVTGSPIVAERRGEAGHLRVRRDQRRTREEHQRLADAAERRTARRAGTGSRRSPSRGRRRSPCRPGRPRRSSAARR